jgi:hypothetical protein
LTQRHQIGVGLVIEPATPLDELTTKIPEMSDRPAERRQA